jgi:hypothetical protein
MISASSWQSGSIAATNGRPVDRFTVVTVIVAMQGPRATTTAYG